MIEFEAPSHSLRKNTPNGSLGAAYQALHDGQLDLAAQHCSAVLATDNEPDHEKSEEMIAEAWHCLGLIALRKKNFQEAVKCFGRTIQSCPQHKTAFYNLGLSYHSEGQIDEAEKAYQTAAEINSELPELFNNLGIICQYKGDHKKATEYFERTIELSPENIDAYYNASLSNKGEYNITLLKQLTTLSYSMIAPLGDKARIKFTLGKIYDDLGQTEQAFDQYSKANQLVHTPFNIEGLESEIDTIINFFPAEFFSNRLASPTDGENFIFIAGMPRSGTTLVEQILASHSAVEALGESGVIGQTAQSLAQQFPRIGYPDCLVPIIEQNIKVNTSLDKLTPSLGKAFVTEKSITNFLHLGLVRLLYPKAKIIYVKRDPRDTCLSCYFSNFPPSHSYTSELATLARFHNAFNKLMSHWQEVLGASIYTIQYEDLVTDQEKQTESLLDFCKLSHDPNCLDYHRTARIVRSASNWQVRQPMYTSSIGRWKKYKAQLVELLDILETEN